MSARQVAVIVLAASIGALGVIGWMRGTATPELLSTIIGGVVLSIIYVVCGSPSLMQNTSYAASFLV